MKLNGNELLEDSQKYDEVRHAHTLNFYRKSLRNIGEDQQANGISRFQKKSEQDYIIKYLSSAVISREDIDGGVILGINGADLLLKRDNEVFLVHGKHLMDLAHDIYERCIK